MLCRIYRSSLRAEMYLYVPMDRDLTDVPQALMTSFGDAEEVMSLRLTPERKLARVNVLEVLEALASVGYFLQMPPTPDELLRRERADG